KRSLQPKFDITRTSQIIRGSVAMRVRSPWWMRTFVVVIVLIRILKRFHILDHHRREATILECTRTNVGKDILEDLLTKLMLQLDFKRVQRHLEIIQNRDPSDRFQPVPLNPDH